MRHFDDRTTFATLAEHALDRMTQYTMLLKLTVILRQLIQLARWFGWGDDHAAHTSGPAHAEARKEPRHITCYMHVWHVVQIFLHAGAPHGPWRMPATSQAVYVEFPVMDAGALAKAFPSHHNHCHVELQGR